MSQKNNIDVTIVIPTKNGGELFDRVLQSVFSQKTEYLYEVICVDSGSKDNTLDIISNYDVKLYTIPPEEFGHGKTRNYGASKGSGKYIVFITQDALPASDRWLDSFIKAMEIDDDIVGGFGIHYPYPDCNLFDKRDLKGHFEGFGSDNTIYYMEDAERYKNEEGYRHVLAYFSDNNSCLRRDIWEKYPYDDVNFAEDQIWMRKMIELGYKKVYCPYAPVYHSHNYSISSYFGRYFDEFRSLYGLHNYLIVNNWLLVLPRAWYSIIVDYRYLAGLTTMKRREKLNWLWYSVRRNHSKFIGGYLGGRYVNYPQFIKNWLDKHISQQYKQVRG